MDGSQSKVSSEDYHLVHGAADAWIFLRLSGKQGKVLLLVQDNPPLILSGG